jgi:coproporphyrinogen III oxidase-like Fe-S oxidoreductase
LETAQLAFERVSFDLIYARPGQTPAGWEAELRRALSFGTEHLSLYQLTIEPGTRFATLFEKGELKAFDPDEAADLFEVTRAITAAAGLPAYEVSNHARPGAESRHNLTYWRYGDYAGVGPGAHGRRNGVATLRRKKPENWLAAIERNGHGIEREDRLETRDRGVEALLMGLRLAEGIDLARIPDAPIDPGALTGMAAQGLVEREGSRLRVTDAGMPVLEAILRELVIA